MSLELATDAAEIVTALLRRLSWAPASKALGRYEVWTPEETDSDEVIVPINPEAGDYAVLLERARRHILRRYGAEAERLEALLLISAAADLDSTKWQKQTSVDAGLIPWIEGEAIYAAARESLVSAARAVRSKRSVQGKASRYLAKTFMEQVFMGQTEVGSFIVTAHVPASTRFHVSKKSEEAAKVDQRKADVVSGRAIVDVFENSIAAVRDALTEYKRSPRMEMFEDLVPEGVSFELIRSLAALARDGDAAVTVQRGEASTATREITFDAVEAPVLDRVAASFAKVPEPTPVEIVGEVSLLDNSTAAPIRLVRVDVMKGAAARRVRVRLTPEQYDTAVAAHAAHQWLKLSGTLEKDGRDWWLYHASDVGQTTPAEGPAGIQQTVWDDSALEDDE
ncbi:hypothetical protein MRBLMI12_000576 [Microbacterium sp. LMI12-1-1.1]|uniref:Uncharacterized protein n=1 Tax=Microbacterium sp. LWS13-1.2 TaxID=3135264 RepID=A0AAU6SA70_9MICO